MQLQVCEKHVLQGYDRSVLQVCGKSTLFDSKLRARLVLAGQTPKRAL